MALNPSLVVSSPSSTRDGHIRKRVWVAQAIAAGNFLFSKFIGMKKLFYLLAISFALIPVSAFALITGSASTDIIGNVNYTFSDGASGYSYKDNIGYTHYQFSGGLYGNAYTDLTGATHYYFDEVGKNTYVNGVCFFPSGYTCTEESQYQAIYNQAEAGLPKIDGSYMGEQLKGLSALVGGGDALFTPEGREAAIMNGVYGSSLRVCREHIGLYAKAKASYDQCVQSQNERYDQLAQMKLNILKQQLDNERQRLEIEKIKADVNRPTLDEIFGKSQTTAQVNPSIEELRAKYGITPAMLQTVQNKLTPDQLVANISAMEKQGAKPSEIQGYLNYLKEKATPNNKQQIQANPQTQQTPKSTNTQKTKTDGSLFNNITNSNTPFLTSTPQGLAKISSSSIIQQRINSSSQEFFRKIGNWFKGLLSSSGLWNKNNF